MMRPRRAVFDTNIFVAAAFNEQTLSALLVRHARAGRILLIWNRNTRRETERTIAKIPPVHRFSLEGLFLTEGRFDKPTNAQKFTYVLHVPDRKFAALALAAKAPLVTRDTDLLNTRDQGRAVVFTPEEFHPGST